MSVFGALAPAKINLGLFVGPREAMGGRHELASVMQSISLADELTLSPGAAGADADQLVCPALTLEGERNLAGRALAAFREATGWREAPLCLRISKRIPLAAGLGGGSADAAGTLRLAALCSGLGDEPLLRELAADLGADVPAQLVPGRWLAAGAGERLHRLPDPDPPLELLLLPLARGLSTASVYERADELEPPRAQREVDALGARMRVALELGAPLPAARELLHNDLQGAAVSLCPEIAGALASMADTGADATLLSGSGPTVLGLFAGTDAAARARAAGAALAGRAPAPIAARTVGAEFARARELGAGEVHGAGEGR